MWLRTEVNVAQRFSISQPTVSRNIRKSCSVFGVELVRVDGEWELQGEQGLLNRERLVHQRHRLMGGRPLRLEAQYWSGPALCTPMPEGWIAGNFDFLEVERPLQLLRQGIIDAWLGCHPDVPSADDPEVLALRLSRVQPFFVVASDHPLLRRPGPLCLGDLREFPQLPLPDQAFPRVQEILHRYGLWNTPASWRRYRHDQWEGRSESDLYVSLATPFTIGLFPTPQVRLPVECPLEVGEVLLVRRDCFDQPPLQALRHLLLDRLLPWVARCPEVCLDPGAWPGGDGALDRPGEIGQNLPNDGGVP